jgi:hypothetical protein
MKKKKKTHDRKNKIILEHARPSGDILHTKLLAQALAGGVTINEDHRRSPIG